MKYVFSILALALAFTTTARAEGDMRIMSCTVDFKIAGKTTTTRTQNPGWLLAVDKGSEKLKSLGKMKIVLSKKLVNDKPEFRLTVKDGASITELNVGFRSFEIALPIELHEEDGEDGTNYDLLKVACDSGYAAG